MPSKAEGAILAASPKIRGQSTFSYYKKCSDPEFLTLNFDNKKAAGFAAGGFLSAAAQRRCRSN
jgi:hypothetical protein